MAGLLLSTAWHQLLGAEISGASLRHHHAVYGRTQIAKYLPGNVFHLVGRQVLGRRLGHGQARLALASLLEALLLMLIAAALSLPLASRWLDQASLWIGVLAALVLGPVAIRWAQRRGATSCDVAAGLDLSRCGPRLLRVAVLYALFFVVFAMIFWMLALSVSGSGRPAIDLATAIPVVALAWLAGFVTPGPSAGIGVREAVLIAALEGQLGAPASALAALALRFVTIGGDLVFLALGMSFGLAGARSGPIALRDDHA